MPDRVLEIATDTARTEEVQRLLDHEGVAASWCVSEFGQRTVWKAVVWADRVEPLLEELERRYGHAEDFRAVLYPLQAAIPRIEEPEPEQEPEQAGSAPEARRKRVPQRVSRAELYETVHGAAKLNQLYLIQVVLATTVATIGLFRDLGAVVIGAMVIAPLLGPNIALALGTTLGDKALIRRSARTAAAGVVLAFALSAAFGAVARLHADAAAEVAARTSVHWSDLLLALASGVAGTLAFTTGVATALVGVMVAIAILPPTVVAGSLMGAGDWRAGAGACLLVGVNLACVNLAAVVTFLVQGIRPSLWWEAERSKRATRRALLIWIATTVLLAVLVWAGAAPG